MMAHAEMCRRFVEAESRFDVNAITYDGVPIWLLIRQTLTFSMFKKTRVDGGIKPDPEGFAELQTVRVDLLPRDREAEKAAQLEAIKGHAPLDAIFFARTSEHRDRLSGYYSNPFLDPLIALCRGQHSTAKVEFIDRNAPRLPRDEPSLNLHVARDPELKLPDRVEGLDVLDAVTRFVAGIELKRSWLNQTVDSIWRMADAFQRILERCQPRAVFSVCYHGYDAMAWSLACSRVGVHSVDVQHGMQGRNNAMYTHLTAVPPGGYALAPDLFWQWGRQSKHDLEVHLPAAARQPRGVVGGNPQMALFRQPGYAQPSPAQAAFFRQIAGHRHRVLVATGPIDDPLPAFLVEAMKARPSWMWMLRLHPHQRSYIGEFEQMLAGAGVRHWSVGPSTFIPLYMLLPRASHVVTHFSSTAWEATAFDRPTTFFHEYAVATFAPWIDAGVFDYCTDARLIIRSIERADGQLRVPPASPYIVADVDQARRAMDRILGVVRTGSTGLAPPVGFMPAG